MFVARKSNSQWINEPHRSTHKPYGNVTQHQLKILNRIDEHESKNQSN
jgi:hypothetical protein